MSCISMCSDSEELSQEAYIMSASTSNSSLKRLYYQQVEPTASELHYQALKHLGVTGSDNSDNSDSFAQSLKLSQEYGSQTDDDDEIKDVGYHEVEDDEHEVEDDEDEVEDDEDEVKDDEDEVKDDEDDEDVNEAEEEEFIKGIEEASNNSGTIKRKIAHFTFLGPTGSGKTSLMDRLLGRAIKEFLSSTGVCGPIVVVDITVPNLSTYHSVTMVDSDTWKEIDYDVSFLGQMGKDSIIIPSKPADTSKPVLPEVNSIHDVHAHVLSPQVLQGAINRVAELVQVSPRDISLSRVPVLNVKSVASIIKKYGFKRFEKYLKKTSSLYLRDTGGQVEFQEMIALLIVGPSIFFFVFRLDRDLKSKFTVEYRKSPGESLNCYTSSITTEEALLQCLASVYAMDTPDKDSVKTHKPLIFVVGTHADKLGSDATTKIVEINGHLDFIIQSNGFQDLVEYADKDQKCVAFAIDNTSSSDEKFRLIRSRVNIMINHRSEFIIEYPISYLLFCLDLQNFKKSVLTLEECRDLAARHGIVGNQVFYLLHFLHVRIGILRYFNTEGLRHIVVKEPQVLFNKVTDLIVTTFSSGVLRTSEALDYEKKGILSASAFEDVVSSDNDTISPRDFLCLLVHLRIISQISSPGGDDDTERYFIPCVLNHIPESVEKELKTDILPLFVKFRCEHCPKGLYSVMITHFMRPNEEDNSNTSFILLHDRIFKDQVSFEVHSRSLGLHDEISLKFHSSHLKITFFPEQSHDDSSLNKVCTNIRRIVLRFISQSLKDLHYNKVNVDPVMCFKCDDCSELHQIEECRKYSSLYCSKVRKTSRIPVPGRWWYNEGNDIHTSESTSSSSQEILSTAAQSTGTDDPTLNLIDGTPLGGTAAFDDDLGDVCDVLEDLAGQWRTIATDLRLRNGSMNTIESNNSKDVRRCLQLAISDWLSLNYNHERNGCPSWRMLAKAVRKLDGRLFNRIVHEHPACRNLISSIIP